MPFGSQDNLQCRAAFVQRTKTFSLERWTGRQGSSPPPKCRAQVLLKRRLWQACWTRITALLPLRMKTFCRARFNCSVWRCAVADGEGAQPLPPKKRKKEDEPVASAKKLKVISLFFVWVRGGNIYAGFVRFLGTLGNLKRHFSGQESYGQKQHFWPSSRNIFGNFMTVVCG